MAQFLGGYQETEHKLVHNFKLTHACAGVHCYICEVCVGNVFALMPVRACICGQLDMHKQPEQPRQRERQMLTLAHMLTKYLYGRDWCEELSSN